jgi:hypothetical protein
MSLYNKIIKIYPELTESDFNPFVGTIILQNDGGNDYIKEWNHLLPRPTEKQLSEI